MNDARPASMVRAIASRMWRAASRSPAGISSERRKSPPVPRGMIAISVVAPAPACRIPSATSETVPSPPSATTSRRPSCAASRARRVASRGPAVKTLSSSPRPSVSGPTSLAHLPSVRPPPERGLTITSGRRASTSRLNNRSLARLKAAH
jgi:hypothetical protein